MTTDSKLDNFLWPRPQGIDQVPIWRGDAFVLGDKKQRILEFGEAHSHWSSELTALHEQEAGANHPIDRASRWLAIDSLKRFLTVDAPILLDVGCSSGYLLKEIRRALPNALLIGSDYLLPPLIKLAQNIPDLPVLQFDLRRCPLADECVDGVTALNVLEHIDKDEEAFAHIYRILRPGGVAHIEVPAGPHLFDVYDEYLLHHRRYCLSTLKLMARRLGFEILKGTHLGFLVYPAFRMVKKRNRRLAHRQTCKPIAQVTRHIRATGASTVMARLTDIELALSRTISFPFGIRCVLVVRKPQ